MSELTQSLLRISQPTISVKNERSGRVSGNERKSGQSGPCVRISNTAIAYNLLIRLVILVFDGLSLNSGTFRSIFATGVRLTKYLYSRLSFEDARFGMENAPH